MTINLKDNFDLDKVEFTDKELEMPYENPWVTIKDVEASDAKRVMDIALDYANPDESYLEEWHDIYMLAETIYGELNNEE